ncbi:hypothetical protein [Deminuibacter soli]|uniref:Lipoprotein n=1 Tax=Deminuibacter soli TaxID=2291815 RepID=A0A3E1NFC3_9BACT|nr:hypothetical protein [Deminuibacter soli]RFM26572.1 hypothetical protein DXN05_18525 [Deminuibacter soli]
MKSLTRAILFSLFVNLLSACGAKYGCPSNGKNVGAEKIISSDPKAMKDVKKAEKYKLNKF